MSSGSRTLSEQALPLADGCIVVLRCDYEVPLLPLLLLLLLLLLMIMMMMVVVVMMMLLLMLPQLLLLLYTLGLK